MKLLVAIWLLGLLALWLAAHLLLRNRAAESAPAIVAHRGAAAVAPENTMAAVRAGARSGAEFIEVDVQLSSDGAMVLLHDRDLDRTTDGNGRVEELELRQLQALDAGGWFSHEFSGEPLPTLERVVGELEGWSGSLVVEAKRPGAHPGMARELAAFVKRHPEMRFTVVSFDHRWLRICGALLPETPIGELSVLRLALPDPDRVDRIGVYWLAPILDPTLIRRALARGLEVWVWTVDRPWQLRLLAWLGVDAITVNDPARAQGILRR